MYYKGKTKILYIDYNDITKHVVLQDVMGHAVNKLYKKKPKYPHHSLFSNILRNWSFLNVKD